MSMPNDFALFGEYNADTFEAALSELGGLAIEDIAEEVPTKNRKKRATVAASDFKLHFGSNVSNLESWQKLCQVVGITDIPSSITQCKKLLRMIHVNIFDLVDAARCNTEARTFKNTTELANYSKKNNKVFPKNAAKEDKLLKFMLRIIL